MTVAHRLHVEFSECSPAALSEPAGLEAALTRAAAAAGWHVRRTAVETGPATGICGVLLAAEGCLSVHAWPEQGCCSLEALGYSDQDPALLLEPFASAVSARHRLAVRIAHGEGLAPPEAGQPESPCQRLRVAEAGGQLRLYIDGELQFSSLDEYRYHEALVHPALSLAGEPRRVLVVGGGDGLAVREVLKHRPVEQVLLVDIDPGVTDLALHHPILSAINGGALRDPRVTVRHEDAFHYLHAAGAQFDAIIIDFPEPVDPALSNLYALEFVQQVSRCLAPGGVVGAHATSPTWAPVTYWSIVQTARAAGLHVLPYHADVPTFGDWGFYLAAHAPLEPERLVIGAELPTRFLTTECARAMFRFGKDAAAHRRRARLITLAAPIAAVCRAEVHQ